MNGPSNRFVVFSDRTGTRLTGYGLDIPRVGETVTLMIGQPPEHKRFWWRVAAVERDPQANEVTVRLVLKSGGKP